MPADSPNERLRQLPSVTQLLQADAVAAWRRQHPEPLIKECVRRAVTELRQRILAGFEPLPEPGPTPAEAVLEHAARLLAQATQPHIREAINATGVILHTGLGRAVLPPCVVDSMQGELRGYCTLAVDRESGERAERDELVEYILTELTGAEAATVVNNNAAATLLVLAAVAAGREVIVSRGQLIEIGGSFRLPEVMAQSGACLVEVGATNRTHLRDYERAITDRTIALMRVHPSNYRVIGFTSEVALPDLAELAHRRGLLVLDDLGAGALVDLRPFGLPPEPTVRDSIDAGADLVWFSGDKLIGAGQSGVIVGRKALVSQLRKHPLMRAVRVDKTCLITLERTLQLFRQPARLAQDHPTYQMLATSRQTLEARAATLRELIATQAPRVHVESGESCAYLGSGSLPTEAIPSLELRLSVPGLSAQELSRRLRLDEACVFARIEDDLVRLDLRTLTDAQLPAIAGALARVTA